MGILNLVSSLISLSQSENGYTDSEGRRVSVPEIVNAYNELLNQDQELHTAYLELCEEYDKLLDSHDQLFDEYNNLLNSHNQLCDQYNCLIE